jgi:UDP-2,3-diacylglucosamine pyrophosphatase LpxH
MFAAIQYASDLHIDEWKSGTNFFGFITPNAPILVLAGDICPVFHPLFGIFIAWVSTHWYKVIIVAGNHEYYSKGTDAGLQTMSVVDSRIYEIVSKFHNVVFLQNGAHYIIPGTRLCFIGATYWSEIDPSIWKIAVQKKGDCNNIYSAPHRLVHPSTLSTIHSSHKTHIRSAIGELAYRGFKLIIITHHMPTMELLEPEYREEMWRSFYASADDELFSPAVSLWICGHSHRATTYVSPRGTRVVMNARGYNRTNELARTRDVYNPSAVVYV